MSKGWTVLFWALGVFYAVGAIYVTFAAIVMAGEGFLGMASVFLTGAGLLAIFATGCGVAIRATGHFRKMSGNEVDPVSASALWASGLLLPTHRRTSRAPRPSTEEKEAIFFGSLWMTSLIGVTGWAIHDGASWETIALVWAVSLAVYAGGAILLLLPVIIRRRGEEYR